MTGSPTFPPVPAAPPTQPDPYAIARRVPTWPTVLGVIAIVLGVGGLLMGAWGVVWSVLIAVSVFDEAWMDPQTGAAAGMFTVPTIVLMTLYMLLAGMLLIGGIGLVRRRRAAVRWLLIWSVLKIVHSLIHAVAMYIVQQHQIAEWSGGQASFATFERVMLIASSIVSVLWAAALPVFLMIWFHLRRVAADLNEHFEPRPGSPAPALGEATT